jgi:ferric-dicitrate binding protein FerR (iron transport regulator)
VRRGRAPFVVDLGELQIKVLGTSFNVITDEKNDEIIITLLEGKIALYDRRRPKEPEKILTPNDQAVYSGADGGITVSSVRPEAITSWITGIFRFENSTLSDITRELERAFHTKIHIEDERMRNKTFNAVFEDRETLDEILSILQISAKYTIEKQRGEIYLK